MENLMQPKELNFKIRKLAKIRNQYNQVPHLTKNTTWESDKNTVSPFQQVTTRQQ